MYMYMYMYMYIYTYILMWYFTLKKFDNWRGIRHPFLTPYKYPQLYKNYSIQKVVGAPSYNPIYWRHFFQYDFQAFSHPLQVKEN